MKNLILPLMALALFVNSALSQNPIPAASPTPPDEQGVVKIATSLIQVDVTVTDKSGKIITDLRPEEISIFENGKRQEISHFSFVSSVRENSAANRRPTPNTGAQVIPTAPKPENTRRTIALVVDDLSLSWESTYYVRRALKKFVDEQMADGDLVAIIRTSGGIGALQQFTTDRRQLYAAIEKVRWNALGSGGIGAFEPLRALPLGLEEVEGRTMDEAQKDLNEFRSGVFASGTVGAVRYVVRGMQELPGRKSIILMSDGFKLFTEDRDGFLDHTRVMEALRRLIDQANRASVVVYTLDPRGLQIGGMTAADDTAGRTVTQVEQEMTDRRRELKDTLDGLVYLAQQTGGFAIINNNDLPGGVRKILDDQSYYLVAYVPDDETFDPKIARFNRLDIKISRPGARVRYRSGFFGVTNENRAVNAETGSKKLVSALISPFAVNDISLKLNALFGRNPAKAPIVRSLLHIGAQNFGFIDGPNDTKILKLDILAMGFGENGVPVDQISTANTVTLNKEQYQNFLRRGFVYDFTFPVKKPGPYQLRIAIRDHVTDKVGSANQFIDIPDLKKNRLTLSGAGLENLTLQEWEKRNSGNGGPAGSPLMDTSLRQYKKGTVLSYGFVIFNAKSDQSKLPNLSSRSRLFKDGRVVFEGKVLPVSFAGQTDQKAVNFMSSLNLGTALPAGEYVLEVAITDNLAKGKHATAANYIQFEILD